ncbi:MAG: putative DNA binding domain-containing protein [Flexilinea sp.]|nr:putative DNA binding domain-containing protein [Flexilinea sp.]
MYLEEITNKVELESRNMECKAELNKTDTINWLKTIAGFANAEGGILYIGVEDKTHKLIGFSRKDADKERNFFNKGLNENLSPRPRVKIDFLRYVNNGRELFIIQVTVPESEIKPVVLRYNNVPSIFMRRDGFTNGATYEEIIEMSIKSRKTQYDVLPSDELYYRSNFSKLLDFYSVHNNGAELTDKALASLGFFDSDKHLKNGAVLFEDEYTGEKTGVQCSVFSGFTKGSERIVTINHFHGNIIDSIEYILSFLKQRMNHSIIKQASGRINIDAFPERALFEGVINAIAHRDYYLNGTQIQIDLFKDRLEISSPGGFYQGQSFGKTYDLSSIISKRRNELICGIFVKCNVMEAAGTGFDKIMEDYRSADDRHKPFIYARSDHFTLVLPDLTYAEGVVDNTYPEIVYPPIGNPSKHDEKILSYCYPAARKAQDIAEYLGISNSTYLRKNILQNLVDNGLLEMHSETGTTFYRTNHDTVLEG